MPQEDISMREMLEAGVHFGHRTSRWNPKMDKYIFGARNGIYIIDLQQTVPMFKKAYQFLLDVTARGEKILFVGTKKQAQEVVRDEARRGGQYFVNSRWLGGTLTNYRTIRASIERLRRLEKMEEDGTFTRLSKKEVLGLTREQTKLERSLGGIKEMTKLPGALFVVDTKKEHIAVAEARKLGIPVVGLVDTNCDPDDVDFVIPGNDDAIRAIRIFVQKAADATSEGESVFQKVLIERKAEERNRKESESSVAKAAPKASEDKPAGGPTVEVVRAPGAAEVAAQAPANEPAKAPTNP